MYDIPDLLLAPLLDTIREKLLQQHPATDDEYSDFPDKIRADLSVSFLSGLSSVAAAHPDSPVAKNKKGFGAKLLAPVLSLVRDKLQELRPSDHAAYLKFTEQIKLNARIKLTFAISGLAQSSNPSTAALSSFVISDASNQLDQIRSECIRPKQVVGPRLSPPSIDSPPRRGRHPRARVERHCVAARQQPAVPQQDRPNARVPGGDRARRHQAGQLLFPLRTQRAG